MSEACAAKGYRPRNPRLTPLYRLVETFYEEVKGCWEERFERLYGRWRGFLDRVVTSYVDCGNFSCGFARVRCPECASELLVAFSCQTRSFCPSCAAKRAAIFGAYLVEEVVAEVGHAQWVFTVPKMLRPYFLCRIRHRKYYADSGTMPTLAGPSKPVKALGEIDAA